jgi:hypothetical protein
MKGKEIRGLIKDKEWKKEFDNIARLSRDITKSEESRNQLIRLIKRMDSIDERILVRFAWVHIRGRMAVSHHLWEEFTEGIAKSEIQHKIRQLIDDTDPECISTGLNMLYYNDDLETAELFIDDIIQLLKSPTEEINGTASVALDTYLDKFPDRFIYIHDILWKSKSKRHNIAAIQAISTKAGRMNLKQNLDKLFNYVKGKNGTNLDIFLLSWLPLIQRWNNPTKEEILEFSKTMQLILNCENIPERLRRNLKRDLNIVIRNFHNKKGIPEENLRPLIELAT